MSIPAATRDPGNPDTESRTGRSATVFAAAFPVLVVVTLLVVDLPMCASRNLLGIPCPGCGLTRAARAMLSLDFASAFALHPMVFVLAPLLAISMVRTVLVSMRWIGPEARDPLRALPRWFYVTLAFGLFALWAVRLATGTHPDGFSFGESPFAQLLVGLV